MEFFVKKPILSVTIPLQTEVIALHSEIIMGYEWDSPNQINALWPVLGKLNAPQGVYSVLGNHDH